MKKKKLNYRNQSVGVLYYIKSKVIEILYDDLIVFYFNAFFGEVLLFSREIRLFLFLFLYAHILRGTIGYVNALTVIARAVLPLGLCGPKPRAANFFSV